MTTMTSAWPALSFGAWQPTCDTLHAHTQVLGKIATSLAPPEPELQHAALRLTARGWETALLPAPDGSGALVVALDLHHHQVRAEHSDGRCFQVPLTPNRPVGEVTRELLDGLRSLVGPIDFDPKPQEVSWSIPLDEDDQHTTYETERVGAYLAAATQAALVLSAIRAPYRGRSTPVNAWWGSFDVAVNLYSGLPAEPPSTGFITRNAMDAQEVAIGWWPGDEGHPSAAFYSYTHPAPPGYAEAALTPQTAYWDRTLGEYLLEWDDVRRAEHPHETALEFARSAVQHACTVCGWNRDLAASVVGSPPPVR
jgi:hypothetical protein